MSALLDRRLVVVTGKGGVGKTTVAAALGLVAARRGRRTVVCEVAQQERLAGLFGVHDVGNREAELAPGLFSVSIQPERAMHEWLRHQLKSGALAGLLGHSRLFGYLTAAAPGVTELVTMGKVWDLAQAKRRTGGSAFDTVIMDAPATGHALALLRAPRTYANIARVGPIARQAGSIDAFLRDRSATGVVCVALPEEMPVNETVDLERRLGEDLGLEIDQVVANAVLPERFDAGEVKRLREAGTGAAVAAALIGEQRTRGQQEQLARLRAEIRAPVTTLPYLFEPEPLRRELELLSDRLEEAQ
ncbi:MAG: AAA family ATPase [Thermoleophilaceae bacterium]|nr:AAA family ATPase [Thermoleophilaceae bacterium]